MKRKNDPAQRTPNAEMTAQSQIKILSAAVSCLAERGYAGTTMSEIAQRVGVTRATLVYHFQDKYALMAAAANAIYDEMSTRFTVAAPPFLNSKERILILLDISYELTSSYNQMALIELLLASRRDPDCRAAVAPVIEKRDQEFLQNWHSITSGMPKQQQRLDLLKDMAVSMFRGISICRSLDPDATTFDIQYAVLRRLIVDETQ